MLSEEALSALEVAATAEMWRRGRLDYKLDPSKASIYRDFHAAPQLSQFVFEKSRKVGGSYLALILAFEACIKNPGRRVNYGTGTSKAAMEIVVPLISKIAADAPPELTPTYNGQSGHITFPQDGPAKGAYVVLFGCEDQVKADRGRGPESVLNILDEAGFIPVLRYVLSDVLKPQVIHTKGKTLVLSSPPLSPGHEFCEIADAAALRGLYAHRNIYSPGGLMTAEEIEAYVESFAADLGLTIEQFKRTSTYKREVLGQRAIDETLAIVPEFTNLEAEIVKERLRPDGFEYVHTFVSIDPGKTDFSGGLFAYTDYLAGGIYVIEDEFLLKNASSTRPLADIVKTKESDLWPGKKVFYRVIDDDGERLIPDFFTEHGLKFSRAVKPDRDQQINMMNLLFNSKRVFIHPRCVNLIRQLRNAVRTKPGGDMIRTPTDGHFDLISSARYLLTEMHKYSTMNPYPPDWDLKPGQVRAGGPSRDEPSALQKAFLGGTPLGRRLLKGKTKY